MRKIYFPLAGLLLVVLDQFSKYWIVKNISLGEVRPFLPGIFSLTYLQNNGAFSFNAPRSAVAVCHYHFYRGWFCSLLLCQAYQGEFLASLWSLAYHIWCL